MKPKEAKQRTNLLVVVLTYYISDCRCTNDRGTHYRLRMLAQFRIVLSILRDLYNRPDVTNYRTLIISE